MTWKLSQRSLKNLAGVHPDLVKVVHRALERSPVDFCVVEGLRTEAPQRQLQAAVVFKIHRWNPHEQIGGYYVSLVENNHAPLIGIY